MKNITMDIELKGLRPLMFDRYPGSNGTKLNPEEKMYLIKSNLVLPSINIYSLLVAENSKSACKGYFGKSWKIPAHCIASATQIEPFDIPILANGKQIKFEGFNNKIYIHQSVARLKGGIPNNKERPVLAPPWSLKFTMRMVESNDLTFTMMRNIFDYAGTMGVGTFRPFFGRFELKKFALIGG